jgi:hypothetical protein
LERERNDGIEERKENKLKMWNGISVGLCCTLVSRISDLNEEKRNCRMYFPIISTWKEVHIMPNGIIYETRIALL